MSVPTDAEARKILSRFIASHFRTTDKEHARFRIPADPAHDDDLRMSQYIDGVAALRAENERLAGALRHCARELQYVLDADPCEHWEIHQSGEAKACVALAEEVLGPMRGWPKEPNASMIAALARPGAGKEGERG